MKRSFNLSLGQTVALTITASVVMASTFLLMPLFHLNCDHGTLAFWRRLTLCMLPFAVGIYFYIKASSDLEHGIASQRWPQDEITSFRGIFETTLWRAFSVGIMIVGCVIMIVGCVIMFAETHPRDIAWFFFILGQSLTRMSYIFRKTPKERPPMDDWRQRPALSSNHWGQR